MFHAVKMRFRATGQHVLLSLCLGTLVLSSFAAPESMGAATPIRSTVIPLKPFGIPKGLFSSGGVGCRHTHPAGTRLFWISADRLFVAFTTNTPCTFHAEQQDDAGIRGIVFDRKGNALATHAWPESQGDLNLFPGPKGTILFRRGARLDVYSAGLELLESGLLDQNPRGLWVTPLHRTIPLLSADGHVFEFYEPDPLDQISTIAIDQTSESNAVKEWVPGDEQVAGAYCSGALPYTCSRIIVLTTDARFLSPDGAPWTYEETGKAVALKPVGFLDAHHLVVIRAEKGFFHTPQVLIVRPNGQALTLPSPGARFTANRIVGVTPQADRFALEFLAPGNCETCVGERYYSVIDADGGKLAFEAATSPEFGDGAMSPDGKAFAVLGNSAITIYPLFGMGQ